MADFLLSMRLWKLRLKRAFNISKGSTEEKETLIVNFGDGLGEGSPSVHYGLPAKELCERMQALLSGLPGIVDEDELEGTIEALLPRLNVGRCALDLALHDNRSKRAGVPLHRFLNLPHPGRVKSSFTITPGTEKEIGSQIELAGPFEAIKLKVGFARDFEFVDYILKRKQCRIRLDANGGWTTDQAIEHLRLLSGYPIDFIEQPVYDPSVRDLDKIKTMVESVIFLDESVIGGEDLVKFAPVIDGINIKLARCGGIAASIKLAKLARDHNLKLMLGCMIETAIGITAALHLASLFDYFDLDSIMLTDNDPFWGAHFEGQELLLPDGNGIAVTTEENTLV
jgi:L-Ala-D/L-Glu epimerase